MSYYVLSKNVFGLGRKNADGSMMMGACQHERSYRMERQQKVYGENYLICCLLVESIF